MTLRSDPSVIRILYAASNQILFKFLFISLFGRVRLLFPIFLRTRFLSDVPSMFSLVEKKSKNLNFEKARFRLEERKFKTRLRDFVFGSQRERIQNLKLAFQSSRNYYYYMKIYGLIILF